MLNQETTTNLHNLIAAHRQTLTHLIKQAAQYGGEVFAPPQTANGIAQARAEIARIKAVLREGSAEVQDEPNDTISAPTKPIHSERVAGDQISGDKVGGDKIGGDKVIGSQTNVNTGGGDYVEGGIDNRAGIFAETIQGLGVGVNRGTININLQPSFTPALHQLRAPVGDFIGRKQEIDQLVQALSKAATTTAAAAISGVRGMGGIGKSELAYAAGQQLKDTFSDAQLLVELRGASRRPLTPEQALLTVIRTFEREAKLPDDLGQLQALYRDKLTGKRVLILADDARDAAQVRSLLPPPGCALLVTSRNRFSLPGMVALDLGTLPPIEAKQLLLQICPRIGAHALELAKLCAHLPLALRVSAGVLEANDTRDVARYLEQLGAERLKQLSDPDNPEDPQASVEASLQLSYEALKLALQATLCQLTVFPKNFDLAAAEAVVAADSAVETHLDVLRRRSLLEWNPAVGQFSLHGLVRAFAAAQMKDDDMVRLRYVRYCAGVAEHTDELYRAWDLCDAIIRNQPALARQGWEQAKLIAMRLMNLASARADADGIVRAANRMQELLQLLPDVQGKAIASSTDVLALLAEVTSDNDDTAQQWSKVLPLLVNLSRELESGEIRGVIEQAKFLEPLYRGRQARIDGDAAAQSWFAQALSAAPPLWTVRLVR